MADRYWRGGTGTWNTTSTTNWSATSGGAGGASVPTASDNVIFDQAATYNVTMTGALACLSITVSAGTVSFLTGTTPTLQVNGSMSLVAGTVWTSTGAITFNSTTTGQTITTNGTTINGAITFDGVGGEWSLGSALTTGATLTTTLTNGALSLNGYDLTTGIFSSSNANTRSIAFGSNNIILSHTTAAQTVLSMAIATGFTYTSSGTFASGTGTFQATMSTTRTFVFGTTGGTATNAPRLYLVSGASIATLTTGSWFGELDFGTTAFTLAATSLNLNSIVSNSTTSVTTNLTATIRGTGQLAIGPTIGPLTINSTSGTTIISYGQGIACTTFTLTSGTVDMSGGAVLTCSSTFTWTGGSLINIGNIYCTTFTLNGPTLDFTGGNIIPSVSFVVTSGSFTLNGGGLGAVPTFTHTAGTVQFNASYSLTATGTYTLTAGTLNINDGVALSTGIFSSSNANTRAINFGLTSTAGWIYLTHTTAATVVLSMANITGLTVNAKSKFALTGQQYLIESGIAGGFRSETTVTKTFTCGTTGGNSANAPCLYVTGTGATQLPTFTTGSWFGDFNIGGLSTMTIAVTTVNINTYVAYAYYNSVNTTSMNVNFVGSGVITNESNIDNTFGILGAATINHSGTTSMVYGICAATTVALTAGTLECRYWANGPFEGYGQFILTGAFTQTGGSWYNNAVYIANCTTYTVNGATVSFNSGSITATTSMVMTSGSFTLNGGTLSSVPTFTHTAGTVTFNYPYSLTTTGTYTQTAGSLILARGSTLSTGIFSSTGAGTRSISFGSTISSSTTGSIYFDGSTSYLTVADNNVLALGTGDFTIEAWINPITVDAGQNQFNIINIGSLQFYVSGGTLYFYDANVNAGGGTVVINQWQHLAVTRIGTLVTAYINGVPYISTTSSVNFTAATTVIASNAEFGGTRAYGYISNLRVVKGVSVYTIAAFTPPTTALTAVTNTQLLVDAASSGAYLTDGSTNNFTLTPTGSVTYNASTPVSTGGSLYFDQSTISYLTLPSSTAFDITGDFTIEAWINPTTLLAGNNGIVDARVAAQSAAPWCFYVDGNGKLTFFTGTYYTSTSSITANVWTHVAVVRSGSILTFFINGVQNGSTNIGTGAISPGATEAMIGTKDFGINAQFRTIDHITNLRFVNGTALYTPNSGSFTPPTSTLAITQTANTNGNPSAAISGPQTSLLLNAAYGSNFLTDSSIYSLTLTNTTATSAKISPYLANINLTHTTAATVVLNMAALGGFSYTGTGGFTVADMSNTRTFSVGNTSGGSLTTAPRLTFTTGASIPTLTTASWFNNLDFGTTSFAIAATSLNIIGDLTLSSSGTFTNLTAIMVDTGTATLTTNGKTIAALTFNGLGGVFTFADTLTITGALTLTAGSISTPYNITSASFASAGPNPRSIVGTNTTYTISGAGATAWSFGSTGSLALNGAQYVNTPTSSAFTLGTGDFTIEYWIYMTDVTGTKRICGNVTTNSDTGFSMDTNGTGISIGGWATTTYFTPSPSLSSVFLNKWVHVAWVRISGVETLYLNGVSIGSVTRSLNFSGIGGVYVGVAGSFNVNFPMIGNITNFRVVKGVGVYTGNFTSPTAPLLIAQSAGTNISAVAATQTSLLLSTPFTSFLTDYSTNNFTFTNTGTATANTLSPFAVASPGITFTGFTINMTNAAAKTFAGGGVTYPVLNNGGAGALTVTGSNNFDTISNSVQPTTFTFTINTTQTVNNFNVAGIAGSLVTINSSTAATAATLSKASGTVYGSYLSIRDSTATGGATWYAGPTSTNTSNNTGWIFARLPIVTFGNLTVADGGFTVSNAPVVF